MLDVYSTNQIKVNSVSGTLVKNYRESFFVKFHLNSHLAESLLNINPALERIHNGPKVPVVVIQAMLCGDGVILAEVMHKTDFDALFEKT